jgi:hypothetical protein
MLRVSERGETDTRFFLEHFKESLIADQQNRSLKNKVGG